MKNLAGDRNCDIDIFRELTEAGISTVRHPERIPQEVPAFLTGKLGAFTFTRAWYYWVVDGRVPLALAKELYANPIGASDIRVNGDCSCPEPTSREANWYDPKTGKPLLDLKTKEEFLGYAQSELEFWPDMGKEGLEEYDFVEDPTASGEGFITCYHIDSQAGLNLFVNALKAHGLV